MMNTRKNVFFSVGLASLLIFLMSCGKDNNNPNQPIIPNVPVNFYIQPNTIDFIAAGSWRSYDTEGYKGVFIYRLDQNNFIAYEKACPYDPDQECGVVDIDPNSFTLVDTCCLSRFNIVDGMPVDGPSTLPLLQYLTEFDGSYLHVYN